MNFRRNLHRSLRNGIMQKQYILGGRWRLKKGWKQLIESFLSWVPGQTLHLLDSAELRAHHAKNVITCQRGLCAYMYTRQRALNTHMLTCQYTLRAYVLVCLTSLHIYVLTCQRALNAYMLIQERALYAHVLTCQRALPYYVLMCKRVFRTHVITCQHALRANVLTCSAPLSCLPTHVSTRFASLRTHVPTCLESLASYGLPDHLISLAYLASRCDATFFSFTVIVIEIVHTVGKVWQFNECFYSVTWIHI